MARKGEGYKSYRPGDPIHIVVTQDFVEDANRFFSFCKERGFNPSEIIRQAMVDWLNNQSRTPEHILRQASNPSDNFDEKLLNLLKEKKPAKGRMTLRTVKEVLETQ